MYCACGAFIKASQKRCKDCAVELARSFDTDVVYVQEDHVKQEVEQIMAQEAKPVTEHQMRTSDIREARRQVRNKKITDGLILLAIFGIIGLCLALWFAGR